MNIYDYTKSEDIDKDIFKAVDNITMQVQETQDEFIFSILRQYALNNFQIIIKKEELSQAIQLIKMRKEYGHGIGELWDTAVQQSAALNDSYRRGFQDGVKKEHDRINILMEQLSDNLRKADQEMDEED